MKIIFLIAGFLATGCTAIFPAPITPTVAPIAIATRAPTFRTDCETAWRNTPRYWNDSAPVASPNGKWIATIRNAQDNPRIIIERADKTGMPISVPAPNPSFPLGGLAWSPTSAWLAFSNFIVSGGGGTIYLIKSDGTGLRKLVEYVGFYDQVAWSPDAQAIAFTSGVNRSARPGGGSSSAFVDGYKIYRITISGDTSPEPIAEGCAPVWTP